MKEHELRAISERLGKLAAGLTRANAAERLEEIVKEATCIVCEGPTLHQEVYNGAHRFKADCISYLQTCVKHLTERAAFGDQCYQDRCEGAFVEQSVMQRAVRSAGGGGAM